MEDWYTLLHESKDQRNFLLPLVGGYLLLWSTGNSVASRNSKAFA